MNKLSTFIGCFLIVISCQTPQKEQTKPISPFTELVTLMDQYANHTIKSEHINSVALAIYRNGEVYHNYYGELDKNEHNTPHDLTYYEMASVTKVFAGSLAANAVLKGKIDLDDDIRKYLNSPYPNLEYNGHPITIKHLLTHTLGFKNKTPKRLQQIIDNLNKGDYENAPIPYTMQDLLKELEEMTLDKQPGTHFEYNSVGPELMAYILEQVYDKPYSDILSEFLKELDMNHTFLQGTRPVQLAHGYKDSNSIAPVDKHFLLGGGFGMISTLPDLIKFMKFQLESEHPLIKESTKVLFEDNDDNTMGYLWQDLGVGKEEGFYYSKTGTANGTQSGMLICPDSHYGMIIIVNNNTEDSFRNWASLFNEVEFELIKYPKLNLLSLLKPDFIKQPERALKTFNELKHTKDTYYTAPEWFNAIGYEFLYTLKDVNTAIKIFELATEEHPKDANLFDSLGEAYFVGKDYKNAELSFKTSLKLNPENKNAKEYLIKIKEMQKH